MLDKWTAVTAWLDSKMQLSQYNAHKGSESEHLGIVSAGHGVSNISECIWNTYIIHLQCIYSVSGMCIDINVYTHWLLSCPWGQWPNITPIRHRHPRWAAWLRPALQSRATTKKTAKCCNMVTSPVVRCRMSLQFRSQPKVEKNKRIPPVVSGWNLLYFNNFVGPNFLGIGDSMFLWDLAIWKCLHKSKTTSLYSAFINGGSCAFPTVHYSSCIWFCPGTRQKTQDLTRATRHWQQLPRWRGSVPYHEGVDMGLSQN